ncbi:unnamed protein product (macronuclear) [Paramecium tetraurelia]|uniref:CSC1/OSCA1-like 7TM region domain-containing protein n=1 Tax=Paramecium tetraurelia TaxID=5888 RepID=A0D504_PARTE|nr:uncharacterized protein GSPATT00013568001 [Paramecium tetraurelia]CAK78121.1 unnamed protein product [Paramecium tetraurelia]|eukprot:XP_001445518.1 hypothetical protein (macronuclear) [Paramecium tetraurelia strain d4-2]
MREQLDLLLFPIEIVVFCGLAFGIFKLKKKFPNLLFPCHGVTLYLSPDGEDLKESKDKKIKTLVQIKTMPSQAQHFQQVPFSNDMEITMLFIYMLLAQFSIVETMKMIGSALGYYVIDSGMLFYFDGIIVMMIIRNIFKAATIGGYDSQQTKMSIVICIISIVITIFINLGFKDFLNINMRHEFQRQAVHLEIVLRTLIQPGVWSFMGQFGDMFVIVLALMVSIIIFCILPILIRFGNCFTELKNSLITDKSQSKFFYLVASQLIAHIFYVALYIKPLIQNLNYVFHFQFLAILVITILQMMTFKMEMDKHMAKGYDWIMILKDQPEQQDYVKRRVEGLLRGFVIVAYQLLSRIAIPFLLYMILLLKNSQIPETNVRYNYLPANYDVNEQYCVKENIVMMDFLFEDKDDPVEDVNSDPSKIIMKRITKYGIFTKSFIYTFIEFILFNYYFISFVLSVFYIFFLNKTQSVKQTQKKKKQ